MPPLDNNETHVDHIKIYPFQYIEPLYILNKTLELKGLKTFQILPLRTIFRDRFIPINTQALRDIFNGIDYSTTDMKNISDEELWKKYGKNILI